MVDGDKRKSEKMKRNIVKYVAKPASDKEALWFRWSLTFLFATFFCLLGFFIPICSPPMEFHLGFLDLPLVNLGWDTECTGYITDKKEVQNKVLFSESECTKIRYSFDFIYRHQKMSASCFSQQDIPINQEVSIEFFGENPHLARMRGGTLHFSWENDVFIFSTCLLIYLGIVIGSYFRLRQDG